MLNGHGNGAGSWQVARGMIVRAFIDMEVPEIARLVDQAGWCDVAVRRATRCANSLLAVYGPGDYRIVTWERLRVSAVREKIGWMAHPFRG